MFCSKCSHISYTMWLLHYCPADCDGFPICCKGFEGRVITKEDGGVHCHHYENLVELIVLQSAFIFDSTIGTWRLH
jgi:hypothetical protein